MPVPLDITKQALIEAAVKEVAAGFHGHVSTITFDMGKDWSGEWAIFFHVVLADNASRGSKLARVTTEVRRRLAEKLRELNIRLIGYSDFRSESELQELQRHRA